MTAANCPRNQLVQILHKLRITEKYYAVHGNTAAEVIVARADHTKEHMGLTSWRNAPDGKIVKADVFIAQNY